MHPDIETRPWGILKVGSPRLLKILYNKWLEEKINRKENLNFRKPKKRRFRFFWTTLFCLLLLGAGWLFYAQRLDFLSGTDGPFRVFAFFKNMAPKTIAQTQAEIDDILKDKKDTFGYMAIDLKSGETFGKNQKESFTAASTVKIAFAAYVMNKIDSGALDRNKKWVYKSEDYEEGTGVLIGYPFGTLFPVTEFVKITLSKSDNAAANVILRYMGLNNIQKFLLSKEIYGFDLAENTATPESMAKLMKMIYDGQIVSKDSADELIGYMKDSITPDRIVAGVPDEVPVAHKIGTEVRAISDAAIIYHPKNPYILVVYSKDTNGEDEPRDAIKEISKKVYEYFDSK